MQTDKMREFEEWKQEKIPTAGAVIHAIAYEAWKGGKQSLLSALSGDEVVEMLSGLFRGYTINLQKLQDSQSDDVATVSAMAEDYSQSAIRAITELMEGR